MTSDEIRKPLALGPDDLARPPARPLDYDRLHELLIRHLEAHLPVLVDEAVADAVEPIAEKLVQDLRATVLARLAEEREALVDDIILELRQERGE